MGIEPSGCFDAPTVRSLLEMYPQMAMGPRLPPGYTFVGKHGRLTLQLPPAASGKPGPLLQNLRPTPGKLLRTAWRRHFLDREERLAKAERRAAAGADMQEPS